jgi:hypothetical protein
MRLHRSAVLLAAVACALVRLVGLPAPAAASTNQVAIIEDDNHLLASPTSTYDTLQMFRKLGASMVRVFVPWSYITDDESATKQPAGFNASDSGDYPAGAWERWDTVVRDAKQFGLAVDFVLTGGAPRWAEGNDVPAKIAANINYAWKPVAKAYGQFVTAVATRYSGTYPDPDNPGQTLPRVSFWSLWNEPNFGEDLAPQAIDGSTVSVGPGMYRGLVASGWNALQATGHGHDKIVIGELAARGLSGKASPGHPQGLPGELAQTKPLIFIRTLYCVDSNYNRLKGKAASSVGCPTSGSAARFRTQNPGLFKASGFSDHPYPQNQPPTKEISKDPNYAAFSELPKMWGELDRLQRVYGSTTKFAIYNDEYGYVTRPPNKGPYVSPTTAAYYLNWAEYLSWKQPRIASTMQYLLYDPPPNPLLPQGGFDSGLLTTAGRQKATYGAYRLPVYMPVTTARPGHALEVWGAARPAPGVQQVTHQAQTVQIQLSHAGGAFKTLKTVTITNGRGYFDVRMTFPASGTLRLAWTYPKNDVQLPLDAPGVTVYSRAVHVTVT